MNGKAMLNEEQTLLFGKHKGKKIKFIMDNDPEYLLFLCNSKENCFYMDKEMEEKVINLANTKLIKGYEKKDSGFI